jgi:hypothetical protein
MKKARLVGRAFGTVELVLQLLFQVCISGKGHLCGCGCEIFF